MVLPCGTALCLISIPQTPFIHVPRSRKALAQTGDGHFSPIGGYNPVRDMVLVLDVARFKYPPHWVPLPMLFDAMGYPDPETGKPRGYMRLSAQVHKGCASACDGQRRGHMCLVQQGWGRREQGR